MGKNNVTKRLQMVWLLLLVCLVLPATSWATDVTRSNTDVPPTTNVQVTLLTTPPSNGFKPGDLIDIEVRVSGVDNNNGSFRLDLLDNEFFYNKSIDQEDLINQTSLSFGKNIILKEASFTHGVFFRTNVQIPVKVTAEQLDVPEQVVTTAVSTNAYTWLLDKRFRNGTVQTTDIAIMTLKIELISVAQNIIPPKVSNGLNTFPFFVQYKNSLTSGTVNVDVPVDLNASPLPSGIKTFTTVIAPDGLMAGEPYLYELGVVNIGTTPRYYSLDVRMNQGYMVFNNNLFYDSVLPNTTIASIDEAPLLLNSLSFAYGNIFLNPRKHISTEDEINVNGTSYVMSYLDNDSMFSVQTRDSYCNAPSNGDCGLTPAYIQGDGIHRVFIQGTATLEEAGNVTTLTGSLGQVSAPIVDCQADQTTCKSTGGSVSAAPSNSVVNESLDIAAVSMVKTVSESCIELGENGNYEIRISGADLRKVGSIWFMTDLMPDQIGFNTISQNFTKSYPNNNGFEWGFKSTVTGGGMNYMFNNTNLQIRILLQQEDKSAEVQGSILIDYDWYDEIEFNIQFEVPDTAIAGSVANNARLNVFTPLFNNTISTKGVADELMIPVQDYDEVELVLLQSLNSIVESVLAPFGFTAEVNHQIGCTTLVVSGYKFEDHNANGQRDQGEQGLEGWKITLQGSAGTFETLTDANGLYKFEKLKPGVYQLREEPKEGWRQSFPAGEGFYNVSLTKERPSAEANFGNYRPAQVFGYKYEDRDGSGSFDQGEPAMEGVRVQLRDLSGNVVAEVLTDVNGYYEFAGIDPGHYAVKELIPDGMYQSQPGPAEGGFYYVVLTSGLEVGPKNFGNYYLTSIEGIVYYDGAAPPKAVSLGTILSDRFAAPGVIVSGVRTGPAPLKPSSGEPVILPGSASFSIATDQEGYFRVDGLLPGLYTLTVTPPNEYTSVTTPNPLAQILVSGGFVEIEFGLFYDAYAAPEVSRSSITGSVFADANGDARWQFPAETGVSGRTVTLSGTTKRGAALTRTTATNELGTYTFGELPEGRYVVTVQGAAEASISGPLTQRHVVVLGVDEHIGAAGNGAPGGAGWLQAAMAGSDATFGTLVLALDTDADGAADTRYDLSGLARFELGGVTGQARRPFVLRSLAMYGEGANAQALVAATPGMIEGSGELEGSGTTVGGALQTGIVISVGGQYLLASQAIAFAGSADRWPVRNTSAVFNTATGAAPVILRDAFGKEMARILYAEHTPTFGVDFAAERADFGDAPASYGTLRATAGDEFVLTPAGVVYPREGARHLMAWTGTPTLTLGASVTADANGQPNENATGDFDNGVTLPVSVAPNVAFNATVSVTGTGLLSVWVDQNRNGVFESAEKLVSDRSVQTGEQVVALNSGNLTTSGITFVRVRLTTLAGVGPTGLALDGEVEDVQLVIDAALAGGGGLPTSDDGDKSVPTSFALHQNYPNPFNPSTVIPYDLASTGHVRITVYDVTGRPVATLLDAQQNVGRHQVAFNAAGLPSGVYMVRLEAGGQVITSKLTLIK